MAELFTPTEAAYTATALTLTAGPTDEVDFAKWGNPERTKINSALEATNLYQYRRRGVV